MTDHAQLFLVSSFKKQFEDHITCGVCLDQYTNPKTLPCHHSFCLECIEPLTVKIENGTISCPTCRVDHLIPQGTALNLPNAFQINSLLDLHQSLRRQSSNIMEQTTCPKHCDPLKVYCETCCQVICRDCTISEEHKTHKFLLIAECYSKHHQQIQDSLDLDVRQKIADLNIAIAQLAAKESEMEQQGQQLEEEINNHAQRIINGVERSRKHLSQQVKSIVQQKTQVLAAQRLQALNLQTQLKTCQEMIELNLKEWNEIRILTEKHTMIDEMNKASQHVDAALFQPIEKVDMHFIPVSGAEEDIGFIASTPAFEKYSLTFPPCCQPKQPSTATLALHSYGGSPFLLPPLLIASTLSSPGDSNSVKCDITQTQPGKYNITFTPSTRQDQLIVQVGGVDVPDSPFTPPVVPSLDTRGKPVNIITGLNGPYSTAVCDNGDIVVVEFGAHCITILNSRGKKVKSFGTEGTKEGQFTHPHGVAITKNGEILVTDYHRLQKLTTAGVCVQSVGSSNQGNGQQQLAYPYGITVHATTGQIFVADSGNNRIQVFTNDLTFLRSITLHDPFNGPQDVAFDEKGYLYVSESGNDCITKLTMNELCIARFSSQGSTPSCPASLTINNNLVYVTELGNCRVSIFDTKGALLRCFGLKEIGEEESSGPVGITADTIGNLYISDVSNNRIIVC